MWYSVNNLLSYNANINFIIGERGVGKTVDITRYVTDKCIKNNEEFVYIRRYQTELDSKLGNKGSNKYWEQMITLNFFPKYNLFNDSDFMYYNKKSDEENENKKLIGYSIPLTKASNLKSSSFDKVKYIIFDECFILESTHKHYLKNEVQHFLDMVETICRMRNVRVFILSNATSTLNPYFLELDLSLPYGNKSIKTFYDGFIAVEYIKNMEYRDFKKNTRFGKFLNETKFGKYAIDNEFVYDSKTFIQKRGKNSKFYFNIYANNNTYGVWINNEIMCICNDYNNKCPIIISIDPDSHNENTIMMKKSTSVYFKNLFNYFRLGKLRFENAKIKNDLYKIIASNTRT